jgi:hypothetical protein
MPKTLMLILLLFAVSAAPAWSQDDPGDEVYEMQSGDESEAFAEEADDEPIEYADAEDSGEDVIESEGDDAFADVEADSGDASEDQSAAGDEAADETAQSDEEEEAEDSADDEDAGASGDAAAATPDSDAQATDGNSATMNPQGSEPPPPPPPPASPPAPVAMADQHEAQNKAPPSTTTPERAPTSTTASNDSANSWCLVLIDNKQFYAPDVGNYVEFYSQFRCRPSYYESKDGRLIDDLVVSVKISQGGVSVKEDTYRLTPPFMMDGHVEDFYDIQRHPLAPGTYQYDLELKDFENKNAPLKSTHMLTVIEKSDVISISDIQAIEYASPGDPKNDFYKSGYNLIPRLVAFYEKNERSAVATYFEVYNTNSLPDSVFVVRTTLINAATGLEIEEFRLTSERETAPVVSIFLKIDITNLPSGNFILSHTILNRNMMKLATKSYEFERGK